MTRIEEFEELRPLLFSIAYRLLGSVADAEDTVQEAWLRFERSQAKPASVRAYLSTIVTNLALDTLRSHRVKREEYVGEWFPEPLLEDPYEDPARSAELADSLSMASLLLLERLTPLERAVFVLRDVFAFDFAEVASAVNRSEAACRQLLVRARRHMTAGRPRFEADRQEQDRLAASFFSALKNGDVAEIRTLLSADVRLVADAGGNAPLWDGGVSGGDKVARVLVSMATALTKIEVSIEPHELNGQPGAILRDRDGKVLNTWTFDILDAQIQTIRAVLNPDKLAHMGPVADPWELMREATRARRSAAEKG